MTAYNEIVVTLTILTAFTALLWKIFDYYVHSIDKFRNTPNTGLLVRKISRKHTKACSYRTD